MNRLASVVLVGLLAFLASEPAYAQQGSRRVGIGVSIGNVFDIFPQAQTETVTSPTILIPIQVTDGFRLEPEVGGFRSSVETIADGSDGQTSSFGDSFNGVEVGLGIFRRCSNKTFDSITVFVLVT